MIYSVLASIPSPPVNDFHIGPLRVTFYGIFVMTGVVIAWLVTSRRFAERGGDIEIAERIIIRVVIFGFLGARAAYVSTHLSRFEGEWWKVIAIWEGGLAMYGGLTVGAIVMYLYAKQWGVRFPDFLDSVAPAVPLAQALGRWGNYFNQELFGTPTDLPWGLEIDPVFRPEEYSQFETFHPTFLYESVMNVGLAFFIMWIGNRYPSARGRLVGIYFLGYGLIRFLMELIRTDTSFRLLGLSRNGWVSVGAMILGALVLWWRRLRVEEDRYTLAGTSS
ncbi:MAG: prolipoprotein diacylglyceryl transferase [Actinomycetota bacterium]